MYELCGEYEVFIFADGVFHQDCGGILYYMTKLGLFIQ